MLPADASSQRSRPPRSSELSHTHAARLSYRLLIVPWLRHKLRPIVAWANHPRKPACTLLHSWMALKRRNCRHDRPNRRLDFEQSPFKLRLQRLVRGESSQHSQVIFLPHWTNIIHSSW